jgi:hypothetical protein
MCVLIQIWLYVEISLKYNRNFYFIYWSKIKSNKIFSLFYFEFQCLTKKMTLIFSIKYFVIICNIYNSKHVQWNFIHNSSKILWMEQQTEGLFHCVCTKERIGQQLTISVLSYVIWIQSLVTSDFSLNMFV